MEKDNTFSPEYNLDSTTGYCMPFKGTDAVKVTTHYGESLQDGKVCHGMVFKTDNDMLSAVADGKVIAVGSDATHGLYLIIRYGKY